MLNIRTCLLDRLENVLSVMSLLFCMNLKKENASKNKSKLLNCGFVIKGRKLDIQLIFVLQCNWRLRVQPIRITIELHQTNLSGLIHFVVTSNLHLYQIANSVVILNRKHHAY